MAKPADEAPTFSLVEDLPFRIQRRVGLIPAQGLGVVRRALFYSLLAWLPIVAWAVYAGRILPGSVDEPLLLHFGVHVRFLVAVPALILGEALAHRISLALIPHFLASGVVAPAQRQAFSNVLASVARLRDQTLPWVLMVVLIATWTFFDPTAGGADAAHETNWAASGAGGQLGFGGWWFRYVSRPIFAALLAVWLWRLLLAFLLLKRIARLDLSIVPTHPDGAGGLGFLEGLPKAFGFFAFALSAVLSARLAHSVIYDGVALGSLKGLLGAFLVMVVAICLAPLLTLAAPLGAAKRRALLEYGALVAEHGRLVRRRWILKDEPADAALLQAAEIGPVADTLALYDAVRRMKTVPLGKAAVAGIVVPILIPMLALLSTQVPIKDLLVKIVGTLL